MSTRVTIILDSGAFLPEKSPGQKHVDVGYFETTGTTDLIVSEDGVQAKSPTDIKLGTGKNRIDVQHLAADKSIKVGFTLSPDFTRDLLLKSELYPKDVPDFDESSFDCTFRFHSGDFRSSDVRTRRFKEHGVGGGSASGNDRTTREIAHDVLVEYELGEGETLRIIRDDGRVLWESLPGGGSVTRYEIKVLADDSTTRKYYDNALQHKSQFCWVPNPDPPPVGAP